MCQRSYTDSCRGGAGRGGCGQASSWLCQALYSVVRKSQQHYAIPSNPVSAMMTMAQLTRRTTRVTDQLATTTVKPVTSEIQRSRVAAQALSVKAAQLEKSIAEPAALSGLPTSTWLCTLQGLGEKGGNRMPEHHTRGNPTLGRQQTPPPSGPRIDHMHAP